MCWAELQGQAYLQANPFIDAARDLQHLVWGGRHRGQHQVGHPLVLPDLGGLAHHSGVSGQHGRGTVPSSIVVSFQRLQNGQTGVTSKWAWLCGAKEKAEREPAKGGTESGEMLMKTDGSAGRGCTRKGQVTGNCEEITEVSQMAVTLTEQRG